MVQSRSGLGFTFETAPSWQLAGVVSADKFDGDPTEKLLVFGDVDLTHSAGTEMAQNSVMRYLGAFRDLGHCFEDDTASLRRPDGARACSGRRRGPDNEFRDAGDGEEDSADQKEKAESGEFFAFAWVMRNFEKKEKKAGHCEKNEPDGNSGDFGGNGTH